MHAVNATLFAEGLFAEVNKLLRLTLVLLSPVGPTYPNWPFCEPVSVRATSEEEEP
jgi:hypothetical protein